MLISFLQYKRQRKSSSEPLDPAKRTFLSSLLTVILEKLKWDEESDPEDMDEDDKAAFEELRKVCISSSDTSSNGSRETGRNSGRSWIPHS